MRRARFGRVTAIAITAWLAVIFGNGSAQEWVKLREEGANFYEIQRSFEQHWEGKEIQKGKGYKQFKRWEYWTAPRVYPNGILPAAGQNTMAFKQYLQRHGALMKGAATPEAVATAIPSANWTSLGPNAWTPTAGSVAPGLGRISAIAFHPTNSSIIWVGTPAGGLWNTTDGGASWSTNTDNLTVLGISAIVIDPSNTNTMYIATGDYDSNDTYSIGVLKSTDGGATWNTTGLNWMVSDTRTISRLLLHPTNSNILLAATSDGVWKTTDAGATWSKKISGNYKDMEFKPGDPTTAYLSSGLSFRRSTNTGDTWTQITSGVPTGFNRINIGVSAANADYVYLLAGKSSDSGFLGLYRSTDSGQNFTTQSTTPNILAYLTDGSDAGGQSFYDLALAVSPTNANEIYTGGVNIWKSTDGGVTWSNKTFWKYNAPPSPAAYVHADVHHIEFNGATLYTGTDGGFFRSTDGGTTWSDLTAGMNIMQLYRIGSDPNSANSVYAGAQDNTISRYTGSSTWQSFASGDAMEVIVHPTNASFVFATNQSGSLLRSPNAGASFFSMKNNINETGAWVTPFVMDPVSNTTLYAGFINVWKTTNATSTPTSTVAWTNISNGNVGTDKFVDLKVAPSNSNFIYGVKSTALYKTTNGGTSWSNITAGLPTASYTSIAVAGNDPNKIWVTMSGYNSGNKVYASTDGGATWTNHSGTLPNLPFNTIVYHNNGGLDALYAGADIGVYYRDPTMSDWELYQTGLPNVPISELEVHENSGNLRAATFGRGMWQTPLVPPPGAALAFDGVNDDVSMSLLSTATTNVTLEAWVKWAGAANNPQVIIYNGNTGSSGYGITIFNGTFQSLLGGISFGNSGVSATVGTWTHLALVGSGTTWTLYKDGAVIHSLSGTPSTPTGGSGFGSSPQSSLNYFNGQIDEGRFWNVARSQAEIQAKMNCELAGTETNLIAYYKFNQGTAGENNAGETTLTDIAGGDNNGTLNNFALTGTTSNWVEPGGVVSGTSCTMMALAANAGKDIPNSGGATKLKGFAHGGNGGYTYAWAVESGPNTGSEQFSDASEPDPVFMPTAKGSYVLRLTAKDGMNATASDKVAVTVNSLFSVNISGDDPVVPGSIHEYTATTDAGNPSYLWSAINGTISEDETETPPPGNANTRNPAQIEAGGPQADMLVQVYVTDGNTNDVVYAVKSVTVSNPFELTADAGADRSIIAGGSTTLGGTPAATGGVPSLAYEWAPATGLNDPFVANPLASPATTTTYLLTVTDGYNTIATDEVTVTVNELVVKPFVFVGNKVTLKSTKQTTPAGNVHSNGLLTVEKGKPSTYNSNLTAIGKITINKQNTINGNVKSQTSISNSGTITGTKTIGPVNNEPLPSLAYTAGGANKTVPNGGSLTLVPGSYGNVTLSQGGTLKLTSGDYYMNELRYSSTISNGVIEIDLSSGNPVTINLVTNFQFGNEGEIRLLPNGESDSKLVTFNTKQSTAVNLGREAYLLGNFNAPNAILTLVKNTQLRGTVCAKEILVSNDCLFLHHDSPGTLPGPGNLPKTPGEVYEVESDNAPVTSFELAQNYPNPFNPATAIRFALPEAGSVSVKLYSLSGQIVRELVNGNLANGRHEVIWDGRDETGAVVAGGIYFYRLTVQGENGEVKFTQTRKMTFVK